MCCWAANGRNVTCNVSTHPEATYSGEDRRDAVLHGRSGAEVGGARACWSVTRGHVLGSSEHPPTELHIPPTVQGVLAARIDRLSADEKALLQQLAVIGRDSR